jgi:hypothetical protein
MEHENGESQQKLILHQLSLRNDCFLFLCPQGLEINFIKQKADSYDRILKWYHRIPGLKFESLQAFDVRYQSPSTIKVMLTIDGFCYLLMVCFASKRFYSCTLVSKFKLVAEEGETVADAKFSECMNLVYTKKPLVLGDWNKRSIMEKLYFRKITEVPLFWHRMRKDAFETVLLHKVKHCNAQPLKIHFTSDFLRIVLASDESIELVSCFYFGEERGNQMNAPKVKRKLEEMTEETLRTKSIKERFNDSNIVDVTELARSKFHNRGSKDDFMDPRQVKHLRDLEECKITSIATCNGDQEDRLIFVAMSGLNPSLYVVGGLQAGMRIVHFEGSSRIFNSRKDEYLTFQGLHVRLTKVQSIAPFNPHKLWKFDGKDKRISYGLKLMDYSVIFYCPERETMVVVELRIKAHATFKRRDDKASMDQAIEDKINGPHLLHDYEVYHSQTFLAPDFKCAEEGRSEKDLEELYAVKNSMVLNDRNMKPLCSVNLGIEERDVDDTEELEDGAPLFRLTGVTPFENTVIRCMWVDHMGFNKLLTFRHYQQAKEGTTGKEQYKCSFLMRGVDLPIMEEFRDDFQRKKYLERKKPKEGWKEDQRARGGAERREQYADKGQDNHFRRGQREDTGREQPSHNRREHRNYEENESRPQRQNYGEQPRQNRGNREQTGNYASGREQREQYTGERGQTGQGRRPQKKDWDAAWDEGPQGHQGRKKEQVAEKYGANESRGEGQSRNRRILETSESGDISLRGGGESFHSEEQSYESFREYQYDETEEDPGRGRQHEGRGHQRDHRQYGEYGHQGNAGHYGHQGQQGQYQNHYGEYEGYRGGRGSYHRRYDK